MNTINSQKKSKINKNLIEATRSTNLMIETELITIERRALSKEIENDLSKHGFLNRYHLQLESDFKKHISNVLEIVDKQHSNDSEYLNYYKQILQQHGQYCLNMAKQDMQFFLLYLNLLSKQHQQQTQQQTNNEKIHNIQFAFYYIDDNNENININVTTDFLSTINYIAPKYVINVYFNNQKKIKMYSIFNDKSNNDNSDYENNDYINIPQSQMQSLQNNVFNATNKKKFSNQNKNNNNNSDKNIISNKSSKLEKEINFCFGNEQNKESENGNENHSENEIENENEGQNVNETSIIWRFYNAKRRKENKKCLKFPTKLNTFHLRHKSSIVQFDNNKCNIMHKRRGPEPPVVTFRSNYPIPEGIFMYYFEVTGSNFLQQFNEELNKQQEEEKQNNNINNNNNSNLNDENANYHLHGYFGLLPKSDIKILYKKNQSKPN